MEAEAVASVEEAQASLEASQEHLAALQQERRDISTQQGKLPAREIGQFYALQRRLDDLGREIPLAEETVTLCQLALLDARVAEAKRVVAELQPVFNEQERKVRAEQEKLSAIGLQMRPSQLTLRGAASDRGMLTIKLENQRAERLGQRGIDAAPVIRSLQHIAWGRA